MSSGILGSGDFAYRAQDGWAKWPDGWDSGDVAAVGVDRWDNVYAFNRGPHPMVVFDRDGNFLRSFREGVFKNAHGVHMGADDTIFLTDDGDHTMRRCTLDGKVLLTIGIPGKSSAYMSGEPFNRCTHTAMSPQGDIYISDGYCNARVHNVAVASQYVVLALRQTGTKAPFPQRAAAAVDAVYVLHVALPEMFHHLACAVGLLRSEQQMHMVGHQHVGVNGTAKAT